MKDIYEINAKIFKALSDQNRLKILHILSDGERCACELLKHFDFTQPTLSHHMKVLMECGLVDSRKEGTWNYYSLNKDNANELIRFLNELMLSNKELIIEKSSDCDC